jgi:hypothetical protein
LGGGIIAFAFAIASNGSMAIMFPVLGLPFLLLGEPGDLQRRLQRAVLFTLPFAVLGFAAAIGFTACDCTAAEDTFGLDNAHRTFFIYLGRLVYPVGLEPPTYIDPPHLIAGLLLFVVTIVMLAVGPVVGRIGAAWMLLAIAPHALIETHTAHRFMYLAAPGFGFLVAGIVAAFEPHARRIGTAGGLALAALVVLLVVPWYSWQTHRENGPYREATGDWELLHDELARVFPRVPPGTTVEVIGGPLTHPLDNFYVMPALAFTMWGPETRLQTFAPDDPYAAQLRGRVHPYAAEFVGNELRPIAPVSNPRN